MTTYWTTIDLQKKNEVLTKKPKQKRESKQIICVCKIKLSRKLLKNGCINIISLVFIS